MGPLRCCRAAAFAWKVDGAALYPATNAFIKGFVDRRELAGTLAAIGKGQDAAVFFGAGVQSIDGGVPVGPDTLWRLYSMTKPITGIAAMLLIEDGKMTLDQPIADFLPAFATMQVQNVPDGSITDVRPAKGPDHRPPADHAYRRARLWHHPEGADQESL